MAEGPVTRASGPLPANPTRGDMDRASTVDMTVHLKPGKDRPVRFGHPWIFSGAIHDLDPKAEPGTIVRVRSAEGEVLGLGYVNPRCAIAVRMLTHADELIDGTFMRGRVEQALRLRRFTVADDTTAYRLINGEGDRLPGFVVDRYADVLVLQVLTAGAERLKPLLLAALRDTVTPRALFERSDGSVRKAEGLSARVGIVDGDLPSELIVRENGLAFAVRPAVGQKTGLFLDQRPNHALARQLAGGRRVLDAFSYTGTFAIHAGAGGASHVVAVESSAGALTAVREHWALNRLPAPQAEFIEGDVSRYLRETNEGFGLLILDPPAFVKRRKDLAPGARAYKDLNLWALRRAEAGAFMMTFTCSQHVDSELFRKIVLGAAVDAGRRVQLLHHLGPGPDHPVALGHPEGEYLHGLLLRVL